MALWFCLKSCGLCCMCLSVWAIFQLGLMGVFYYIETPILIEDVEAHHPKSFEDFITKTRGNYRQNAYNCWVVAGAYLVTCILSILCIVISNKKMAAADRKLRSEDLVCGPASWEKKGKAAADKNKPATGKDKDKKGDKKDDKKGDKKDDKKGDKKPDKKPDKKDDKKDKGKK